MGGAIESKIRSINKLNVNSFVKIEEDKPIQKDKKDIKNHSLDQEISSTKFPSTNQDIDWLHQNHFITKSIWSSNFFSPIENLLNDGATVLDVNCGAGTFLLDLSNKYPLSEFIGLDNTRLFPISIKPNNLNFIDATTLEGLPFQKNYFDFAHLSIIEPLYTLNQWNYIIEELLR